MAQTPELRAGARPTELQPLLDAILRTIPDALMLIDQDGILAAFSASAEKLFGHAAADVVGQNVSCLMDGHDRQHHDQYISNYLKSGEAQIIGKGRVVQARHASGTLIPVHLTIGETHVGDQRMFAGFVRDVTEKQSQEHRLSQLQAELNGFARLSTAGTMASAMAHELNQPLTAVANYLEAARDMFESPDEETIALVREALDAAAKQSIRAGQIVRKLRDYVSRGEFETQPTEIAPLVQDAVSLGKLGVDGIKPRIVTDIPEAAPAVLIDRIQIKQVILNLLRNAVDAMKDTESPMIWIDVDASQGDQVTLSVSDNGPGLDLGDDRSPFEPFQSSKSNGMGLGLSICQGIVEAHGGTIWAGRHPDRGGAVFSFTLNKA